MNVKDFAKWTFVAGAIVAVQFASAAPEATVSDTIRLYRVGIDSREVVPDHLAYLALMQGIRQREVDHGSSSNVSHIKTHLGMNDEQADAFRQFVLSSFEEMTETNIEVTQRMLCLNDRARYRTGEAYAVLDILDDIKETNLRRQLHKVYVNFGPERSEEIALWLEDIKAGRAGHEHDRRPSLDDHRFTIEKIVASACRAFASN